MRHRFVTCDVFTDTRFGGNPLAVLPDARGLTDAQMQAVAREFNYSETTFVLPPERGGDRRVRIFTPSREVPFAGHPNVGTAFVLSMLGEVGELDEPGELDGPSARRVVFEEDAGDVPVSVRWLGAGRVLCELRAPEPLSLGREAPVELVAAGIGLEPSAVVTSAHAPLEASVGLPFMLVELADLTALARARPDAAALERLIDHGAATADVHCYVRTGSTEPGPGGTAAPVVRARMFAPFDGVVEDPATGSANAALVALLTALDQREDFDGAWVLRQGIEMGRPSRLLARTEKRLGEVIGVWIGGESVLVAEGTIEA